MTLAVLLLPIALAVALIPVWLLRGHARNGRDSFVAVQPTRPEVVRNASIAYALRIAALGPLFAAGASGDLWAAIVVSASFGLGVHAIYVLRRPLLEFVDGALVGDRSTTLHEFIARQHGNDSRVRRVTAALTVLALAGLVVVELLVVAMLAKPLLPAGVVYALLLTILLATVLFVIPAGHSGVMHSAQLMLGMLYLGLFGSLVLLVYLQVSALAPMTPQGTIALVAIAVICAVVLWYRRSRYVDTDPIRPVADQPGGRGAARLVSRFAKILNAGVSVLLVLIVVVALMALFAAGPTAVLQASATALSMEARLPGPGLITLCLLPLVHPFVDAAHWQKLAALRSGSNAVQLGQQSLDMRRVFATYGLESALILLLVCMLGAVAVTGTGGVQTFIEQLVTGRDAANSMIVALLGICVVLVVLSTTISLFSATLATIHFDFVGVPGGETVATRRTLVVAGGLALAITVVFCIAIALIRNDATSRAWLALLFAFCCAQLSMAPLVLAPILGRGNVRAGWAIAIAAVAATSGATAAIGHLVTGREAWLWSAVPACLGSGFVLFVVARLASRRPG